MGSRYGVVRRGVGLGRRWVALVAIALLTFGLGSCAKPIQPTELIAEPTAQPNRLTGQMAEVSPPAAIETLKQIIDAYTPQVRILSPRPGEVLKDTAVTVRLQARGLPLFKDETWGLGPHLHLFLDGEPYRAIYDATEPVTFEDLAPGTHTLRVFASRPWHESFKNQGAYDQRTFHIYAPTPQNEVNASAPLLTYSRPQGSYGAEPIMLDFYLTNAPLHMSAQADSGDDLHDWRVRCTVNDQSFVFDQWQPIWLKGFKPGRNWVQLELIDEAGNPIENRFNNTVRAIDYAPGGTDTLSRLVRSEVDLKAVAGIIDPTYVPPAPPEPEPIAAPAEQPEPATAAEPELGGPAPEPPSPPQGMTPPDRPKEPKPDPTPPAIAPGANSPRPNPFLLPDSPLKAPAPTAPGPGDEKLLIDEIQEILDEAIAPEPAAVDSPPDGETGPAPGPEPELPDSGQQARPAPIAPSAIEPAEPVPLPQSPPPEESPTDPQSPATKGLLNRFRQWRDQPPGTPPAERPAPPPGLLAAPEPPPGIAAADPSPEEPSMAQSQEDEGDREASPGLAEPPDLPRIEIPELTQPRAMPRSPLAPEVRPFI